MTINSFPIQTTTIDISSFVDATNSVSASAALATTEADRAEAAATLLEVASLSYTRSEFAVLDVPIDAIVILIDGVAFLQADDGPDEFLSVNGIQYMPMRFTPEMFGAGGYGETADEDAVLACFTAMREFGLVGYFEGKYRLDSLVTVTMLEDEHIEFFGAGSTSKTFIINNSSGGITFGNLTEKQLSVKMHNIHFYPNLPDSGKPFDVLREEGGLDADATALIENVYCGILDEGDETTNDFSEGCSFVGNYRSIFRNFKIASRNSTTKWTYVLDISGMYKPEFWGCYFNVGKSAGALYGLRNDGSDQEGFIWVESTMNGADYGHYFVRETREPGFRQTQGHFNSELCNLYIDGLKLATIDGTLFYTANAQPDVIDVHIVDGDALTFTNMAFRNPADLTKRHFYLEPDPTKPLAVVRNIRIHITSLLADTNGTAPIYIGEGCTNIEIHLPWYIPEEDNSSYPADLVEIHTNVPASEVKIFTAGGVFSYNGGSASGPDWDLIRRSPTPAKNDSLGSFRVRGLNDAGAVKTFASLTASMREITSGTEEGRAKVNAMIAGTSTTVIQGDKPNGADETCMSVLAFTDAAGTILDLIRVEVGANDTGDTGYRVLQIPNSV